jgi:hypothetical protein
MVSLKKKIFISILSAILFFVLSLPFTYKLVNMLTIKMGIDIEADGCPNIKGIAVHSVVLFLVTFILMLF